jgi:hypothetical protein
LVNELKLSPCVLAHINPCRKVKVPLNFSSFAGACERFQRQDMHNGEEDAF